MFTISSLGSSACMLGLKCPFAVTIFTQLLRISCRAQKACLRLLPLQEGETSGSDCLSLPHACCRICRSTLHRFARRPFPRSPIFVFSSTADHSRIMDGSSCSVSTWALMTVS